MLQLVTRPALVVLTSFVEHPTKENASALVVIPALYNILRLEGKRERYPPDLLGTCRWLMGRTTEVLTALIIHATPCVEEDINGSDADSEWKRVGDIVQLPQFSELSCNRLVVATVCHKLGTGPSTRS